MNVIALASFVASLTITGLLTVFLFRQKGLYLKATQKTLITANLAFATILFSWFICYLIPSKTVATYMIKISVTSVLFFIGAMGWAAMLLHLGPKFKSLKSSYGELLSSKKYFLPFAIYFTYSIATATLTWVSTPFQMVANYPWTIGKISYVPMWTAWYQTYLLGNIALIEVYPCLFAVLASRRYKMKIQVQTILSLAVCLAFTSCLLLSAMMLIPLGLEWTGLLACTLPLGVVAYYFRKATALEIFFEKIPPAIGVGEDIDAFSKTLGLNHRQIAGRKILLEFDPASNYEKAIQGLVTEALANGEPIVIFTRNNSAIHSALREQKAVKLLCLTDQVSFPKAVSKNEMLLPSSDTSLMLATIDKTLNVRPQGAIKVVFDNLSDLVLFTSFEETYQFMKSAVEMLASPRATVLFLLNRTAHDPKVASSLRSLVNNQIFFGKEGIQTVKLPKAEVGTGV